MLNEFPSLSLLSSANLYSISIGRSLLVLLIANRIGLILNRFKWKRIPERDGQTGLEE